MKHNDFLQRFLFEDIAVRGEIIHLDQSFQSICKQHNYPPLIQRFLGEALVLVSLLSAIIKFKGQLTLQFQSKAKLKLLIAQCDSSNHIRGLAQWVEEVTTHDLSDALQQGLVVITMEPEVGKRYQGVVSCQNGSLTASIEGYFKTSEQLPTRIWVATSNSHAAGLLLQVIPREGDKHHRAQAVFQDDEWDHLTILTNTLNSDELLTLSSEQILRRLYVEESIRLFAPEPVQFQCRCTVKRCEDAIMLLGQHEAEEEIAVKQHILITCEFCNKTYKFDKIDVERIFCQGNKPPTSDKMQ